MEALPFHRSSHLHAAVVARRRKTLYRSQVAKAVGAIQGKASEDERHHHRHHRQLEESSAKLKKLLAVLGFSLDTAKLFAGETRWKVEEIFKGHRRPKESNHSGPSSSRQAQSGAASSAASTSPLAMKKRDEERKKGYGIVCRESIQKAKTCHTTSCVLKRETTACGPRQCDAQYPGSLQDA